MFRPVFDVFLIDTKMKADKKTDCRNVGSDFWIGSLQRHIAAISAGNPCRGGPVDKIRNFEEKSFSKKK